MNPTQKQFSLNRAASKSNFLSVSNAMVCLVCLVALLFVGVASGATILPPYSSSYSIRDLGNVPGVPTRYGGVAFKAGDADTLLIGGEAEGVNARIYAIRLVRGSDGHIIGFTNTAQTFSTARGLLTSNGGIDGGLDYGPSNVLFYTSYDDNSVGQIRSGEVTPAKRIALTPLGVSPSVGGLVFVPPGFPSAGRLKLLSYNANTWYDTSITPDASGTFNIASVGIAAAVPLVDRGPEGAVFVRGGNPHFPDNSVLICEFPWGMVGAYRLDANSDPMPITRSTFISGMEGAEGATMDPVTGDFVFSSFGGTHSVYVVGTFPNPPPLVAISAPTNNSTSMACFTVTLEAIASPGAGSPDPVTQVEFFDGTNSLAVLPVPPYRLLLPDLAVGAHALTAVVRITTGQQGTSSVVNVTIVAPAVDHLVASLHTNGQCRVCFIGQAGSNYVLEATAALTSPIVWSPVQTNLATSLIRYTETNTTGLPQRFYRARRSP